MRSKLLGFVLGFAAGLLTVSVLLWATGRIPQPAEPRHIEQPQANGQAENRPGKLPEPHSFDLTIPEISSADRSLDPRPSEAMKLTEAESPRGIGLPIAGLTRTDLRDTFQEGRGEGRSHEAVDIMAPRGTPVLAVVEGNVAKIFTSKQGGLTVYQFDNEKQYSYYYAHLDRYAAGLQEGMLLRRGDVLGYVGSSGNADPSAPHLHFSIFRLGADKKWWEGEPINPYPLLIDALP
jgi:murein DD-endopeptidase MepM/ murein hydrolase activator NlpD